MPKTLEDYLKEFSDHLCRRGKSECTIHNYTYAVRHLLCNITSDRHKEQKYILKYTPEKLTYKYLEEYCYRVKQELSSNTQKSKLAGIKRYLKFIKAKYNNPLYDEYEREKELYHGKDEDILRANPISDIQKEPLTPEEIQAFFDYSKRDNLRNHALLQMFYYTAQRIHSLVNMNIEDIDFTPKQNQNGEIYYNVTIKYRKGRYRKPITIPVCQDCIDAVKEYLEVREQPKEGFIIDNYRNKLYHKDALFLSGGGRRFRGVGVYRMMKRYAMKLGITKNVHPHIFRHTSITAMDKAGMSEGEIKRISGHAKMSNAIKTYINPSNTDIITKSQRALSLDNSKPKPIKKQEQPSETYIAKPIQSNKLKELELKLIEQLANGEISNKTYNDAISRLKNIGKQDTEITGYM